MFETNRVKDFFNKKLWINRYEKLKIQESVQLNMFTWNLINYMNKLVFFFFRFWNISSQIRFYLNPIKYNFSPKYINITRILLRELMFGSKLYTE